MKPFSNLKLVLKLKIVRSITSNVISIQKCSSLLASHLLLQLVFLKCLQVLIAIALAPVSSSRSRLIGRTPILVGTPFGRPGEQPRNRLAVLDLVVGRVRGVAAAVLVPAPEQRWVEDGPAKFKVELKKVYQLDCKIVKFHVTLRNHLIP